MKASSGSLTGMLVRMWEEETAESREAVRLKYHIRGLGDDDQQPRSHSPRSSDQTGGGREQSNAPRRGRGHHHHHHHNQARQLPRPEVIYEADEEFDDEGAGGGGRGPQVVVGLSLSAVSGIQTQQFWQPFLKLCTTQFCGFILY